MTTASAAGARAATTAAMPRRPTPPRPPPWTRCSRTPGCRSPDRAEAGRSGRHRSLVQSLPAPFRRPPRAGIRSGDDCHHADHPAGGRSVAVAASPSSPLRRGAACAPPRTRSITLARSWSEDGTSRGRVCAAAQLVAGAQAAFLAEPTRRGDALRDHRGRRRPGARRPRGADRPRALACSPRVPVGAADPHRRAPRTSRRGPRELLDGPASRSVHMHPVFHGEPRRRRARARLAQPSARARRRPATSSSRRSPARPRRAIERDAHVALLARQARTDELTALPNRRAWDEAVEREMARAAAHRRAAVPRAARPRPLQGLQRHPRPPGRRRAPAPHRGGLAARAARDRRARPLRRRGVRRPAARAATSSEAGEVIDRVRAATPSGESASAGVVAYDGRESPDSLLARADAALYRAKHAGRATTVPALAAAGKVTPPSRIWRSRWRSSPRS